MTKYHYLIIGGGMTADAAVKGIRSVDSKGTIGIITSEQYMPYARPPLSKSLWAGDPVENVWLKHAKENADILLSRTAIEIRISEKQVVDDKSETSSFDKLLIATGGRVRKFPFETDGIIYFRTLDDYNMLRFLIEKDKEPTVVVGGGFIGSEIAAALAMNDRKVIMVFPEDGVCARVFPPRLSSFLNEYYKSKGIEVLSNQGVDSILKKDNTYILRTTAGKEVETGSVVAGLGIQPNVELARAAGLEVDSGIIVNELLQTSHPDIYAAGDVANFLNPELGRMRVEHEDNANTMGEHAGRNMAGKSEPYHHLPFFYSDLFDLGYEAVGKLNGEFQVVEDWKDEFREGVVYFLEKQQVCGVLLWNTWEQVDNARKLIALKKTITPNKLIGKLPA